MKAACGFYHTGAFFLYSLLQPFPYCTTLFQNPTEVSKKFTKQKSCFQQTVAKAIIFVYNKTQKNQLYTEERTHMGAEEQKTTKI